MNSFEAAFGVGAQNIAERFTQSTQRATSVVTSTLTRMNEWASQGWSSIPHKRAIGLSTAVGIGLAVALSDPPAALNVSPNFIQPDLTSGTGGRHVSQNVHPMPQAVGAPQEPNLTSMMNRAHMSPALKVSVAARALRNVDTQRLENDIRSALGGQARVSTHVSDSRRSLTPQNIADIVGRG